MDMMLHCLRSVAIGINDGCRMSAIGRKRTWRGSRRSIECDWPLHAYQDGVMSVVTYRISSDRRLIFHPGTPTWFAVRVIRSTRSVRPFIGA